MKSKNSLNNYKMHITGKITLFLIALLFSVHFNNAMNDGSTEYHSSPVKKTVFGSIIKYDFWNKQNQPASVEYNTQTQRYSYEFVREGAYGQSQIVRYGDQNALKELFKI